MYATLAHQGKNRPVNPWFADALKDNILNDYCRTAAYELVKFVYLKEADVLAGWMEECIAAGNGAPVPGEIWADARTKIFDEFKALPLAQMHGDSPCDLPTALTRVLNVIG